MSDIVQIRRDRWSSAAAAAAAACATGIAMPTAINSARVVTGLLTDKLDPAGTRDWDRGGGEGRGGIEDKTLTHETRRPLQITAHTVHSTVHTPRVADIPSSDSSTSLHMLSAHVTHLQFFKYQTPRCKLSFSVTHNFGVNREDTENEIKTK